MTLNKTKFMLGIATATLTLASAIVAPQVEAATKSKSKTTKSKSYKYKVQKPSKYKKRSVSSSYLGSSSRQVDATSSSDRVRSLESQVEALSSTVNDLKSRISSQGSDVSSSKVQELDQWMASVKAAPVKIETKDNMVFFRGGFAHSNVTRNGVSIASDVAGSGLDLSSNGILPGGQADKNAWYFGAGFDFSLDDNLFGLSDNTEVLAELMFEYKELGPKVQGNVLASNPTPLANGSLLSPTNGFLPVNTSGAAQTRNVMVSQFSLAASPKIKLFKGEDFRPWLIPIGFSMDVISPPSESITVLQPGMIFAAGADYKLWKNIYVGADVRYHYSLGKLDGVNTDGYTAGGYLGLGF
jgi:opacity protein-like surface antigen